MDKENDTASDAPPGRYLTIDRVVAWNLAWYRNQAGLTQEELGKLVGTTKSAISEMERAWNGKRPREFQAQFLASAAAELRIPLTALFLPPFDEHDDSEKEDSQYWFTTSGGEHGKPLRMRDLLLLTMPDNDDQTAVMDAYRYRLRLQAERLLDSDWAEDVARWLRMHEDSDVLRRRAIRLRGSQEDLERAAAEAGRLAAAIEASLDGEAQ